MIGFFSSATQAQLNTRWTKQVSASNATPYPRPQMTRTNWATLNGVWDYAITSKAEVQPSKFAGKILVPFPIESSLSGVQKQLKPDEALWYRRYFAQSVLKSGERLLLHFEAVDWQTTVFINGKQIGQHQGGYDHFSFDITDALQPSENELVVKVLDPGDQGLNPHGKQVLDPKDIWYTPSSGIWQTIWLEAVPQNYIRSLKIMPNVDSGFVAVTVNSNSNEPVTLTAGVLLARGRTNERILLKVPKAHLWSPNDPYLYDLSVKTATDAVKSYFGLRKIEVKKDRKGVDRIFLNNQYTYNLGVLDQGFWPDGLYTAPNDEALAFDIKAIKAMGFNTIRKHIKVEPDRWYYWADKLGMLVWQDMVNPSFDLTAGAKQNFEHESQTHIEQLYDHPSIVTWVLFNEKWGQYDQKRLTNWIKNLDPTRLVNGHTGEILYVNEQLRSPSPDAYVDADMTDVHSYPDPMMPIRQSGKAQVVGEFGGIGVAIPGHEWNTLQGWGYIKVAPAQLAGKYRAMVENLKLLEKDGLSGSIYTQPFDVEGEENGLITYDRAVAKIPLAQLRQINSLLVPTAPNIPKAIVLKTADLSDEGARYAALLDAYVKGKRDTVFLRNLALMSQRVNDKTGGARVANSYIQTLKAPLSEANIKFTLQFTKSSKDPGFALIRQNRAAFEKTSGVKELHNTEMDLIYAGEIAAELVTDAPDWAKIKASTSVYGATGEEIFLRAQTIETLNKKDWAAFVPVAKIYIQQYGDAISTAELTLLKSNIEQHSH